MSSLFGSILLVFDKLTKSSLLCRINTCVLASKRKTYGGGRSVRCPQCSAKHVYVCLNYIEKVHKYL